MNRAKKAIICGTYPQKIPSELSPYLFSPLIYRLGPGTKAVRFPGVPQPEPEEIPGIDISRFRGGTPINAVICRISTLTGNKGAVLHGGSYGRLLSDCAHSISLYVPEPLPHVPFREAVKSTLCPLIRPTAYAVEYIGGIKSVRSLTPDALSDILCAQSSRVFFSDTHMSMYTAASISGGFKFVFFDTLNTLSKKSALALSMKRTPILYQSDIISLARQNALRL